jgi:hypothetical protein
MNEFYSEQQRALQDRFETRAIADSHVGTIVHDEVQEPEKAFIEGRDMFFLSTVQDRHVVPCLSGWLTFTGFPI